MNGIVSYLWWLRIAINSFWSAITYTNKEKLSLTRNSVEYRNWMQEWCKKEGSKVWEKKNETKILYLAMQM